MKYQGKRFTVQKDHQVHLNRHTGSETSLLAGDKIHILEAGWHGSQADHKTAHYRSNRLLGYFGSCRRWISACLGIDILKENKKLLTNAQILEVKR